MSDDRVKIAVPNKGRLRRPALKLLGEAGIEPLYDPSSRSLVSPTSMEKVDLVYVRAEDVPWIVSSGAADLGITGRDLIMESGVDVEELMDLGFGDARLVLASPRPSGIESVKDLPKGSRIATKYVNVAGRFFHELGMEVKIVRVSGAAEAMPALGAAEAIVDVVSTGTTLRMHGLKPVHTIMKSSAVLIAGPDNQGREEAEVVVESIRSVVLARSVKLLLMNVPDDRLEAVVEVLPSMSGPMIAKIRSERPMWEVLVAVPISSLPVLLLELKRRGARDIVTLDAGRLIP